MLGAIFDVDGTILDSMTVWRDISVELFAEHNVIIPPEKMSEYDNMSFEESLFHIQKNYLPELSVEWMAGELVRRAELAYRDTIPAKEGAVAYIKMLYNSGVKIAVATSGFEALCQSAFKRLGIFDLISVYAYSNEVGCNKSNPDIYLLAAKRLGLKPEDCTVYEDIITGITSAKSAGFKTIAIEDSTNALDKERLIQQSDRYITGWFELLSI